MKFAAGVLVLLVAPWTTRPPDPVPSLPAPDLSRPFDSAASTPLGTGPGGQEWLADPVLPAVLRTGDLEAATAAWLEEIPLDLPPLSALVPPPAQDPSPAEPSFPGAITPRDIQAWREEEDLRRIQRWSSDTLFGLPLLVPQWAMESLLPRGLAVGPTTFLYRSSPASTSLAVAVLDQILFHEAEFLTNAQFQAADPAASTDLARSQMRVLRKSFSSGFRASYAVPGLTMDQVFLTAAEQGVAGYLLAPTLGGAILYLKGIDQRIRPHDDVRFRFKLASGQDWVHGARQGDGVPALSFELRLCDFPVGLVGSFDISSRGLIPEFLGIGTSLDAVEDLLGREAAIRNPAFREQ